MHAFTHAKTSLNNAMNTFFLSEKEKEIIKKHMWPLNITIPKYKETYIISMIDKYCAIKEIIISIKKINKKKKYLLPEYTSREN